MSDKTLEQIAYGFAEWLVLRNECSPRLQTLKLWLQYNEKEYLTPPEALSEEDIANIWERWTKYITIEH